MPLAGLATEPLRTTKDETTGVAGALPIEGLKNALVIVVRREVGAVPRPVFPATLPVGSGRARRFLLPPPVVDPNTGLEPAPGDVPGQGRAT